MTRAPDVIDALLGEKGARTLRRSWPACRASIVARRPARALAPLLAAFDLFERVSILAQLHGRFRALPAAQPADRSADLEPRQFALLHQTGTWLMLPQVDRTVAPCQRWLPAIAGALGVPPTGIQCQLYLSGGHGRWSPPLDGKDAFYLGVRGAARVGLGRRSAERARSTQLALTRGTVVFAPRGLARRWFAETECQVLAFELQQPTWLDLVDEEIHRRLLPLEHWRTPIGSLWGSPDERRRELRRLDALLQRVFRDLGAWNAAALVERHAGRPAQLSPP